MVTTKKDSSIYMKRGWNKKLKTIKMWKRQGQTDAWIAKKMGISIATLSIYKDKYEGFKKAMSEGKDSMRAGLEDTMFSIAATRTKKTVTKRQVLNQKTGEIITLVDEKIEDISNTPELTKSLNYLSKAWAKGESEKQVEVFADTKAGQVMISISDIVIPDSEIENVGFIEPSSDEQEDEEIEGVE